MKVEINNRIDPDPEIKISITLRKSEWISMNRVFGRNNTIPAELLAKGELTVEEKIILSNNLGDLHFMIDEMFR